MIVVCKDIVRAYEPLYGAHIVKLHILLEKMRVQLCT